METMLLIFCCIVLLLGTAADGIEKRKAKFPPQRRLTKPEQVEIRWYELIQKRHTYIDDASLYYLQQFFNPFHFSRILEDFNDVNKHFPITHVMSFTCPTPTASASRRTELIRDMKNRFIEYLYVCRLQSISSIKAYWKKFYPSFASSVRHFPMNDDIEPTLVEDTFNHLQGVTVPFDRPMDRRFWLFDFILNPSSEFGGLRMFEERLKALSDPNVLFEDLAIEEQSPTPQGKYLDKDFIREHRTMCHQTHLAVMKELQKVLQSVIINIPKLGKGICNIDVKAERKAMMDSNIINAEINDEEKGPKDEIQYSGNLHDNEEWTISALKEHFVPTFLTMQQNDTIHQEVYGILMETYLSEYLIPFLEHDFCSILSYDISKEKHPPRVAVAQDSSYRECDGQIKDIHLLVKERSLENTTSIGKCLSGMTSIMQFDTNYLADRFKKCEVFERGLYFAKNFSQAAKNEILLRDSYGGSMTIRDVGCFVVESQSPAMAVSEDQFCVPISIDLADYNTLNILAAFAIAPEAMDTATHISDDISSKSLVLGFGGGEFHHALIKSFPSMSVESVDISSGVVTIGFDYFGMGNLVCEVKEYDNERHEFQRVEHALSNSIGIIDSNIVKIDSNDCRSKLTVMDGWAYIRQQSENIDVSPETTEGFDYIFLDAYDEKSTNWEGNAYSGESVPAGSTMIYTIPSVKKLLRPTTGVLVAHLHKDMNFKRYYDKMVEVFGVNDVTVFEVSLNDAIIVASRDRFGVEFEEVQFTGGGESINNSINKNNHYTSLSHPCNEEDRAAFPMKMLDNAKLLNLTPHMSLMYLLSLNCNPFVSYTGTSV